MSIDYDAEGLLDGLDGEQSRTARLELLQALEAEGFSLEELRTAAAEDRLALLPVERILEAEGPRYTQRAAAEEVGLELDFLREARRALGQPVGDPDEPALTEEDIELSRQAKLLVDSGIPAEDFLDLTRVMSNAMGSTAAALVTILGRALLRPGDNERDLGLRYAESLRELGPLAGPALTAMLNIRMREEIRRAVVSRAELESGLPGAQPVVIAFVDIVGFTELGEQVPPDELGAVVGDFERRVERATRPPVRLVKTIGDAAMLASPDPGPLLDSVLELVETSQEDDSAPLLRAGVASGEALARAGDLYGRPVNLASRLTSFARRGSVVTSGELRELVENGYSWSFAGERRFKGVGGATAVYRVRPADAA